MLLRFSILTIETIMWTENEIVYIDESESLFYRPSVQRFYISHGTSTVNTRFRRQCYQTRGLGARLGYFWLPRHVQQSLTATLLLLGYFWLPGREMSWNRAPLWKIVNFLSIQGDFEPFQRQWADLSSIDRI